MRKIALAAILLSMGAAPAEAEDLFRRDNWSALASDRRPEKIGDAITIIIAENQQASNSVRQGSKKNAAVDGRIFAGRSFDKSAGASVGGSYEGEGTSARNDRSVAQLSAVVTAVEPNGDLRIAGWQRLKINGEMTNIKVAGRIRPQDVTGDNLVLSSRLADATIEYEGRGFASRSAKPGIVSRIFSWLGIL